MNSKAVVTSSQGVVLPAVAFLLMRILREMRGVDYLKDMRTAILSKEYLGSDAGKRGLFVVNSWTMDKSTAKRGLTGHKGDGRRIRLRSCNGEIVTIPLDIIWCARTLYDAWDVDREDEDPIPLPATPGNTLRTIVEFMTMNTAEPILRLPRPLPYNGLDGVCTPAWAKTFVDRMEEDRLVDLMTQASYLDIPELRQICAAKLASELRKVDHSLLSIPPMTKEEEELLKTKYAWTMEPDEDFVNDLTNRDFLRGPRSR